MAQPIPDSDQPPFARLISIIRILRGEHGCPWDQKQTPETMLKYLREECQELIEALERGDNTNICEEMGDALFVFAFLISIYEERGQFTSDDVFSGIIDKMIRRHPHVFGDVQVHDEKELRDQWETIKAQEKAASHS